MAQSTARSSAGGGTPTPAGVRAEGVDPAEATSEPGLTGRERRWFVGSVGFMLSQLGYFTSRRFAEVLAPLRLEPRTFALLRYVANQEGGSQQTLAEALQIPPSRMVALLDDLQGRGLLERRPNPDDRRSHALYLTATGRGLLAEATKVAIAHEQRVSGALTPAEREQLLGLLNAIAADLGLGAVHPDLRGTGG